jgi:hypothetical protein
VKPHRFDLIALLFGLAFAMVGGAFLAHEATDSNVDPAWVSAAVLTVLGVVALVATLLRPQSEPATIETGESPEATDEA